MALPGLRAEFLVISPRPVDAWGPLVPSSTWMILWLLRSWTRLLRQACCSTICWTSLVVIGVLTVAAMPLIATAVTLLRVPVAILFVTTALRRYVAIWLAVILGAKAEAGLSGVSGWRSRAMLRITCFLCWTTYGWIAAPSTGWSAGYGSFASILPLPSVLFWQVTAALGTRRCPTLT